MIFPNGVPTPVMPKTTGQSLRMMFTVPTITSNTKHPNPNRADNPVRNLNRSSNNATRDRHNASPRRVKTLRNAKPNPNRDNRVFVAGIPLLEPPRPERLRSFGRILTLLAFAASRRSHGHRGYKFSSVSRRDAAAYPNRCTFVPSATARNHPLTGGFILPA